MATTCLLTHIELPSYSKNDFELDTDTHMYPSILHRTCRRLVPVAQTPTKIPILNCHWLRLPRLWLISIGSTCLFELLVSTK